MKGLVFLGNCEAEVRDFPVPEPAPDEVLIRVMATGICGSDLSVYRLPEGDPNQIRGHEPCGVIEARALRLGSQRERFAPSIGAQCDAVGDGVAQ